MEMIYLISHKRQKGNKENERNALLRGTILQSWSAFTAYTDAFSRYDCKSICVLFCCRQKATAFVGAI